MHGNANSYHDQRKRREQASRRDAVDTRADDCRCFVHGRDFPFAYPLDGPQTAGVNPLSFVGSDKDPTRAVFCLAETNGGFQ